MHLARLVGIGALLACPFTASLFAQESQLKGRVTDERTGDPITGARVLLVGTSRIETTGQDGSYLFRTLSPGDHQVRVLAIGFSAQVKPFTVAPGELSALDFSMTPVPVQLDEIVTTATGQQSRLEIGNAIANIDVSKVTQEAPITEFGNLIQGRAAGVQVLKSSGVVGTGTKIRIRGSNSVSLSNEPLYYIDGVRVDATSQDYAYDIGGQSTSRINDINPEDIENIEIVKGPSAATLYGIQAANGVVLITTKRGAVGKPRWNMYTEQGVTEDKNTYRTNYFGRTDDPAFDPYCSLQNVADGLCTQTRIDKYNPLNDPDQRQFAAGWHQQYGLSVSGGSDFATYYASADFNDQMGAYKLNGFDFDSVNQAKNGNIPEEQLRPNKLSSLSLRANTVAKLASNADLNISLGYLTSQLRLTENDNTLNSMVGSADGSGVPEDLFRGWFIVPAQVFAEQNKQGIGRFTGALTANYRPRSWLTTRATFGYDVTNREDTQFWPTGEVSPDFYPEQNEGELNVTRAQTSQLSVDLGSSANYKVSSNWAGKTSVGGQFFRNLATNSFARGRGITPGGKSIFGAGTTEASDDYIESRSIGGFVEQQMSLRDRLFLTAGLRIDNNSSFGKNFNAQPLPKASVSWLLRDEQNNRLLNTFRLRSAYGQSSQQPGVNDARRFYTQAAVRLDAASETGVSLTNLGNPDLKPEKSQEVEAGFDAGLLRGRVTVEGTFFYKSTTDALVRREIAPSTGGTISQFFNLGRVTNRGFEFRIDSRILDGATLAWDLALSGSFTRNKLNRLGEGVAPITLGFNQQHVEGFPLGGFWAVPIVSFNDANGDGVIEIGEYTLGDSAVYRGSPIPTRELALNSGVSLFKDRLRIGTQFDYRGGHIVDNATEQFRCGGGIAYCRGLMDPTAPLHTQAVAAAGTYPDALGRTTEWGFFEPGWFIKLRELSLTYNAPDVWANYLHASHLSLTVSGRNLWTITDYTGIDPEVNGFGQANFSSTDFFSQPQVRYWMLRVNLGF
ncbi:MAG TPA: SusC/RagA family TonB-linked outer membrane protein [Gemmatimonadales bacterium]|jgi:TonB-linked SusC/RagA family outer membrane protein|nr:SusC/RagA family TonB-linked outer membrane protein [Gemmatimonadales bacterium]